ncbi:hypothetical protein [Leifsonia sp. 22587]|uniref:hypothetical protein n=1 Tax=Leifsonia sp. 22587 TaxID=3453946 RepID=UPI003F8699EB
MMLPPTPRVLALRGLLAAIRRSYRAGRVIVAVDGGGPGGGMAFADDLAAVFRESGADTFRASLDGFHTPRAYRTRLGRESAESYYRDGYDESTLRRVLLDPFRLGGSAGFQLSAFDEARDQPVESRWLTAGQDAVLVVDGEFVLRPSLRGSWNASILLTNAVLDPLYVADADPEGTADFLVDESDAGEPRWVERGP